MAVHTLPGVDPPDTDLMNYAVRMVIPMRREFGTTLDVPHFLHDFTYAREILQQARQSRDPRLREYAAYMETKLFGPRASAPPAAPLPAPLENTEKEEVHITEEEMRRKMLAKYKGSLR